MDKVDILETEARIQQEIVKHYRNGYCLAHHNPRCLILSIPNEGNARLSQTGALAGTSDLLIVDKTQNCYGKSECAERILWIEVKTPVGRLSAAQRKFEAHIGHLGGKHEYHVVRSLDEFKLIIAGWKKAT